MGERQRWTVEVALKALKIVGDELEKVGIVCNDLEKAREHLQVFLSASARQAGEGEGKEG